MKTKRIGFQTPIAPGPIHSSARPACPNLLKPTRSCAVPNTAIVHLDLFLPSVAIYIIIACALVSCYCSQSLFHNPTEPPWLLSEPVAPSDLRFPPRSTHIIIPSILFPLRIVSRTKIIKFNIIDYFHDREKEEACKELLNTLKYKSSLVEDLEAQLAKVIEKNTELTIQNSDLQKKVVELREVTDECEQLKNTLTEVETECTVAKSEVKNLGAKVRNLECVLEEMHKAAENRREIERQHKEALEKLKQKQVVEVPLLIEEEEVFFSFCHSNTIWQIFPLLQKIVLPKSG